MMVIQNSKGSGNQLYGVIDYITDRKFSDRIDAAQFRVPFTEVVAECFKIRGYDCKVDSKIKKLDGGMFKIEYRLYQK